MQPNSSASYKYKHTTFLVMHYHVMLYATALLLFWIHGRHANCRLASTGNPLVVFGSINLEVNGLSNANSLVWFEVWSVWSIKTIKWSHDGPIHRTDPSNSSLSHAM